MKKRYKRQRTALGNNSSRELPGVNVFIHLFGTKKGQCPSDLAGFYWSQVLGFNGNQSQLE